MHPPPSPTPIPPNRRPRPPCPPLPQVGISLILSFMVVWDLPTIQRGVQTLRTSRIAPIYATVAPSLEVFATLFGKALQALVRWGGGGKRFGRICLAFFPH